MTQFDLGVLALLAISGAVGFARGAAREFAALAALAGWRCDRVWTDERAWFSVQWLTTG